MNCILCKAHPAYPFLTVLPDGPRYMAHGQPTPDVPRTFTGYYAPELSEPTCDHCYHTVVDECQAEFIATRVAERHAYRRAVRSGERLLNSNRRCYADR